MDSSKLSVIPEKEETDQIMTAKGNRILVMDDAASRTEIDLHDRVLRKTWRLIGFAYSRTYELDSHATVCIKDKSTIIEGYTMTSFGVYLISRGRDIRISSSDGLKEARHIQSQITEFLKKATVKCSEHIKTTVSGG